MNVTVFDNSSDNGDVAYKEWLAGNPDGFVLTTNRADASAYARLHRSDCHSINIAGRGIGENYFTGNGYIKICSDSVDILYRWAALNARDAIRRCQHCHPLEPDWLALVETELEEAGQFNVKGIEDARHRVMTAIVRRRGQRKFRANLMIAYEGKCAFSGCDAQEALEAAHIYPYLGKQTNVVSNGLLLRADLHTLFDLGLIFVDPATWTTLLAPSIQNLSYGEFHGTRIRLPKRKVDRPSADSLKWHHQQHGLDT